MALRNTKPFNKPNIISKKWKDIKIIGNKRYYDEYHSIRRANFNYTFK